MQALLLRFLENGEIQAVGADHSQARVDVRASPPPIAISTSSSPLASSAKACSTGCQRVIHLHVPPLRERADDVQALMRHFLSLSGGRTVARRCASQALLNYRWPGNVREPPGACRTAGVVVGGRRRQVGVEHLPARLDAQRNTALACANAKRPTAWSPTVVRRARQAGPSFWRARLSVSPGSRHHAARSSGNRSARAARVASAVTSRCTTF